MVSVSSRFCKTLKGIVCSTAALRMRLGSKSRRFVSEHERPKMLQRNANRSTGGYVPIESHLH